MVINVRMFLFFLGSFITTYLVLSILGLALGSFYLVGIVLVVFLANRFFSGIKEKVAPKEN